MTKDADLTISNILEGRAENMSEESKVNSTCNVSVQSTSKAEVERCFL